MARFGTITAAIVQLSLLVAAQRGHLAAARLSRSAAARRCGGLATLVNFIGPGSYFTFGVKRRPGREDRVCRPPARNLLAGSYGRR